MAGSSLSLERSVELGRAVSAGDTCHLQDGRLAPAAPGVLVAEVKRRAISGEHLVAMGRGVANPAGSVGRYKAAMMRVRRDRSRRETRSGRRMSF